MCLQAVIRAVCAIIDAFHFATELPEEPAQAAPSAEAAPHSSGQAPKDAAYVADIQKALAKRVLPALQKQLVQRLISHSILSTLLSSFQSSDRPPSFGTQHTLAADHQ